MNSPPRVLQVHHFRYPTILGGVDRVVVDLLEAYPAGEACLFEVGLWADRWWQTRRVGALRVYRRRLRKSDECLVAWRRVLCDVERRWTEQRIERMLAEESVSVIHLHTLQDYHANWANIAQRLGVPYVVTLHGSETLAYPHQSPSRAARWTKVLKGAAAVTAVSGSLASVAAEHLPLNSKPFAILNGIMDPTSAGFGPHPDSALPYAVCVGALEHYKGQDVAIEAWALLRARGIPLMLKLLGDGSRRTELEALVRRHGLQDQIEFLGAVEHARTIDLLAGSRVFLMPSRTEGLGLALVEAAALRRPIVASDLPVFREIVSDRESAFLFPAGDAVGLADRVAAVLGDATVGEALGRAARKRFESEFMRDRMIAEYRALYERLSRVS